MDADKEGRAESDEGRDGPKVTKGATVTGKQEYDDIMNAVCGPGGRR